MVVHAYRSRAKGVSNLTRIRDLISKTSGCVESLEAREGGGRERERRKSWRIPAFRIFANRRESSDRFDLRMRPQRDERGKSRGEAWQRTSDDRGACLDLAKRRQTAGQSRCCDAGKQNRADHRAHPLIICPIDGDPGSGKTIDKLSSGLIALRIMARERAARTNMCL